METRVITAKPEHRKGILSLLRSLNVSMGPIYKAINNRKVKIAIKGKKILGVILYIPRKESIHIEALTIRVTNRRQGIGIQLIKEIIKTAKKQRKNRVSVATAFVYNAKGFYEKCGFYRTRTWVDSWSMSYKIP
jgi:N-acetylglutamate synthase-like GNAT family acetyltransferase